MTTASAQDTRLPPALVESVLERLGFSRPPSPDHQGLSILYDEWCRHVPFDNARKLIAVRAGDPGPLPGDSPAEFFEAWLDHGVGGTCWAGNVALCELLGTLGFDAHRGVGTMMVAPGLPPNHGTVVVNLPEGDFILDASIMHVEPLVIRSGETSRIDHGAWGVEGHWLEDRFAISWWGLASTDPLDCRIDQWPVDRERFRSQHELTRTWSPFNFELMFNLVRGDGRIGVAQNQAVRRGADGSLALAPLTERMAFLVDELGMSEALAAALPDDIPTPPPPGTRTAAARSNQPT